MKCILGIDIGGTKIKIGKFIESELVEIVEMHTNTTNRGEHILDEVYAKVDELVGEDELIAIGIGVPGPVVDGVVLGAHNLGWGRKDIRAEVLKRYPNIKCTVLNDANAATLGEMAFGGGRGYKDFVFITLGTGIGGGIVINNELIEGSTGSCGEIGHIRVGFHNHRKCNCGLYDCVEQYASATGIVKTAKEFIIGRRTRLHDVEELTSKTIFDIAKDGDYIANEIVNDMVEKFATALSQIANTINPQAFVIGGGVSKAGSFLLNKLEKRFNELAFFSVRGVNFELAKLGNKAGMYGNFYRVGLELNENN
ncbi:MAG TPA: ROK family protein [Acholeplasmataceae bacterium]|jgi:glucokinase|nr:ROK family protein [Acholeplasmataceae bacterium]